MSNDSAVPAVAKYGHGKKKRSHGCLHKGEHLSQEVIDPQNFRPRLASKPVRLHTEPLCQILCPAKMKITRDDENRRCIHAVLFGEHAGILQILTRVVRLFLLNDAVFVHALLYQILRHDVCFGVRLIRALRAGDDDLRLRVIVQVGKAVSSTRNSATSASIPTEP